MSDPILIGKSRENIDLARAVMGNIAPFKGGVEAAPSRASASTVSPTTKKLFGGAPELSVDDIMGGVDDDDIAVSFDSHYDDVDDTDDADNAYIDDIMGGGGGSGSDGASDGDSDNVIVDDEQWIQLHEDDFANAAYIDTAI